MHALMSIYFSLKKNIIVHLLISARHSTQNGELPSRENLLKHDINGKCYKIIYNMYDNIKSCVLDNDKQSFFSSCMTGIRRGENLSHFYFLCF